MAFLLPSGYDTLSYGEDQWAKIHGSFSGRPYAVKGPTDWQVTTIAGQPNRVSIAAGTGYGWGVMDTTTTAEQVTFNANNTGAVRYDLVCAKRNWSTTASGGTPGGVTTFDVVQGTSSRALPVRVRNPGFEDWQPLALVPIFSGTPTVPGAPIDLRTWGTGVVHVNDPLAIDPRDWPIGTEVRLGWGQHPACYRTRINAAGTGVELKQYGRPVASSRTPVFVTTGQYGTAVIQHNLGYTPTSMTFTLRLPSTYDNVISISLFNGSANLNSTQCIISVTIGYADTFTLGTGSAAKTYNTTWSKPFVGNLGYVDWQAFEEIL